MPSQSMSGFFRGSGLVVSGSIFGATLQFVSLIILSRLISPEGFGLMAMVMVFISLGNLLRDFGMPMVALQARELSSQQMSNLFWMNAGTASFAGSLVAAAAPLVALIYSEPRLISIMPFMAISVVFLGISAQLQTQLARAMRYKALVGTEVISKLLGAVTAWIWAFSGGEHWSLVAQSIVSAFILLLGSWIAVGWIPQRFRRGHGSRGMLTSGAQYGVANILSFLQNNADTFIIGVRLGAVPLGFYNRSYQLLYSPVSQMITPLSRVIVPTVNRLKNEKQPFVSFLLKMQFYIGAATIWIFSISAGTAEILIPILLGQGWESVIPIFQILVVGGMFSVLSTVSYWVFLINQQSRELMQYNLITKPMTIIFIFIGANFGLPGVAMGMALGLLVSWPINLIWLNKTANFPGWKFFKNGIGLIICGLVAALTTWITATNLNFESILVKLFISALLGTCCYVLLLSIPRTFRHNLSEGISLMRKIIEKNRNHGDA